MANYTNAASFTAAYFNGTDQYNYRDFLVNNPKIVDMKLIQYTGDATTDRVSAVNEAIKLVGFISQYRFPLHDGKDLQSCIDGVADTLLDKDKKASDISETINETFVFLDEVE